MTVAESEPTLESGAAVFLDTSLIIPATIEVHPSDFRRFHPEVSLIAIDA